jgi:peptide/nickel transport system permease protein
MLFPVIIGVSLLIFLILNLAPGDIISVISGDGMSAEEVQALRAELGYDKPVLVRYLRYMSGLIRGDLGTSYITGRSVFHAYIERLPATMRLAFSSVLFSILLSIPLGIYSATHKGSIRDNISMVGALLGLSMPNFWLGLLLIIAFSLNIKIFPSSGDTGFLSLVLPTITVGTGLMATLTRTTRSSMLDVIRQDYLRTARAKGVPEKKVIRKHALKNALIPIITIIGTQLSNVLGGAVLTETVFSWPGVGRLIVDSINQRDIPMVTGCIILKTITITIILLIVDLLYAAVDPRVKSRFAGARKKRRTAQS